MVQDATILNRTLESDHRLVGAKIILNFKKERFKMKEHIGWKPVEKSL